jgi:hypothetical protein
MRGRANLAALVNLVMAFMTQTSIFVLEFCVYAE